MKTGISTASLYLRQETEQALQTVKELGAKCAEVYLQTFYEYRPEFAKAIAPNICGIEVNSVHVTSVNYEAQLFSPSRRIRGDGFYWLDQVMRSCQLLGCKRYTFHGQTGCHGGGAVNYDELSDYIRGAIEFCYRYGVQLCLENVFWSTYNKPDIFRELKKRVPELAGVFDIKQARRSGYPYQAYIADMAGSISHVHLSDVDDNGKMCLPGKGIYDFEDILKRLQGVGFDGSVILEVYSSNFGEIEELKRSLEYVDEIIYKIS